MQPRDWIALAAVASTVIVAIASLIRDHVRQRQQQQRDDELRAAQQQRDDRLREAQQQREDEIRKAQLQREDEMRERHREDSPHIQFGLDCLVHGQEADEYLIEFVLTAHNKGLVQQKFKRIVLRVRGIRRDEPLAYWKRKGYEPRVAFPEKVIEGAQIIPPQYNFIFVEPGVKQTITYVTKISASFKYIVAHVEFEYDRFTPHAAERTFRLSYRA